VRYFVIDVKLLQVFCSDNVIEISFAVFFHIHGIPSQFNNLRNSLFLDSCNCFLISIIFLSANHGNLRTTLSVSKFSSLYRSDTFDIILLSTKTSTILSPIHSISIQFLDTNQIIFSFICAGHSGFWQ
jgi:hypothetical protein